MLEIDEQVARMLELVIERKVKTNKLKQQTCLDNEEDEDRRSCKEKLMIHNLGIEYCYIE